MNFRLLGIAALAAIALPALAQQGAAKRPVATVNGTPISATRLEYLVQQQVKRGAPDNARTREAIREDLINREVVAQAAAKAGVGKRRDVQVQSDIARQEILVGAYLSDYLRDHPVTDADLQKEYDRVRQQTGKSEYKSRHILVETEDEAKRLIDELRKGGKFEDLAKKSSKDEGTRELGGDLDWKVPSTFEKPFGDALAALEKGKFSTTPVRTRYGYHVIQLDDVRDVQLPPVDQVAPQLRQRLMRQRVDDLVKDLRAKAKIE